MCQRTRYLAEGTSPLTLVQKRAKGFISEFFHSASTNVGVHSVLVKRLNASLSDVAKQAMAALLEGKGELSLRQLRQSARNFTGTELAKELAVHRYLAQWMPEVIAALNEISLSRKNQQHFAERVDYYGAKLKRQSINNQRLYLLCYLHQRWQQARNPKGKRSWRLPTGSKSAMVNNPFFQQLPTTAVADVLRMVDRDTGFIECFRRVLGAQSKNRVYEQDLLALLVGNATNQGTYGISQISDRSYEQLSTIQANYFRLETIEAANNCINNATARLPIFRHYNIQDDIVHASADGQKFEAKRATFKTRYSSKYFGAQKGVSAMSLIANHAAINAKVIGSNEHESHYIFDLLFNNTSDIKPEVLSTDTHGVNHVNFAFLDLFGYSFAPRYAQPGRIINEMFAVTEDEAGKVNLSLRTPINTKCIARHWD